MRYRINLHKALALLLAVMIMISQPAMTILAAESVPGVEPLEIPGSSLGDTPEPDTPALTESEPEVPPSPEIPPEGEESSLPGAPEESSQPEALESSEEEKPPASSEPETPDELLSEPEIPEESLPEIPLLPELPPLPELPLIPVEELPEIVEEQEPVIETAPLGQPRMMARGLMATFSAGDGSVAKLVADNHVVMQRADGRLLMWGDNTYGQLGLGAGAAQKVYTPTQNTFFKDKKIQDIAVVQDATFVLLSNGELYAFGKGTNGRLGLGSSTNVSTPTLIPGSQGLRINGLYPMKESMVVTTDNNAIYVWGRNDKGQLGDGTKVDKNTPTRIMDNANVKSLHVGDDYAILIKEDDTLWTWGNNASGVFPYDSRYKVTSSYKGSPSVNQNTNTYIGSASISPGTVYSGQPNVGSSATYNMNLPEALNSLAPGDATYKPIAQNFSGVASQTLNTSFSCYYSGDDGRENQSYSHSYGLSGSANINYTVSKLTVNYSGSGSWSGNSSVTPPDYTRNTSTYPKTISFNATASNSASWTLAPAYLDFSNSTVVGNITHIMPGSKHWYMIQDGQLYSQGDNSLKQQASDQTSGGYLSTAQTIRAYINTLDAAGDSFSELVVSGDTNYIITGNGDVHAWGGNASGKTGTGQTATYVDAPAAVYTLNDKSIASIVAGRNFALFVSHTGDVYAVGDNLHGQTGLGEESKEEAKITMPQKIETFKFSETELPPEAPENVEAPEEVDAGTQISIKWRSASNAVAYELQRTVNLKEDNGTQAQMLTTSLFSAADFSPLSADGLGLEVAEVVYNGDQTQYTDTAQSNWDTVTYSVKALNSIGDYSPEKTSNAIAVKAKIPDPEPTTDTTPPVLTITTDKASKTISITAVDADSGMEGIYINGEKKGTDTASYVISSGETVSIYGKDNAGNASATRSISYTDVVGGGDDNNNGGGNNNNGGNNNSGGGLTDAQLLAILAALKSGNGSSGIDNDTLLALTTAMRRSNPVVTNNTGSGVDEALLKSLIQSLQSSKPTQNTTPKETVRYVQTNGSTEPKEDGLSPEILSLLLSQLQGDQSNGGGNDLLTAFLLVKLLSEDKEPKTQEQIVPAPQGTSMTVGIFLAVLTVATILMAAAFPLTVIYFNRKLKAAAGGPKPEPEGSPDGDSVWKDRYNQVAREYNDLVDMVNQAEPPKEAEAPQE